MKKPCRRQPEGLQENYLTHLDYHLTALKAQALHSRRRARSTVAPRSWLPAFQRVHDARGYGPACHAVEALAHGLVWRGQQPEQICKDLVQLVPMAYRDVVLPCVHAAAIAQGAA